MDNAFNYLRGTINIDTSPHALLLSLNNLLSQNRTGLWENYFLFFTCPRISQRLHDLRDHITGSFDQHCIPDTQIFFLMYSSL
jgi:hypothetical protein